MHTVGSIAVVQIVEGVVSIEVEAAFFDGGVGRSLRELQTDRFTRPVAECDAAVPGWVAIKKVDVEEEGVAIKFGRLCLRFQRQRPTNQL